MPDQKSAPPLELARFGPDDVETLARKPLFEGHFPNARVTLRRRSYAGEMSGPFDREVFGGWNSVSVLPYDPRMDAVLLVEQFRPVPHLHGDDAWLAQPIAGFIEDGEDIEEALRRETREEANLEIGRLELIASMYLSPGALLERNQLYAAPADLSQAGGTHGLEEEHEDIRAIVADASDAIAATRDGRLRDAMTIVAMNWLERERPRIRTEWA